MNLLRKKLSNAKVSYQALYVLLKEETSFQIQMIAAVVVFIFSFLLNISKTEFIFVILIIASVLTTEAINTAIEELCDHVTPEHHYRIGKIKDISSGASGIMGIAAIIVGLVIFIPHLTALL